MGVHPAGTPERPALHFDAPEDFAAWLAEHHATAREIWTLLPRRHAARQGLRYDAAVREALRFGWIDSVEQRLDADAVRLRWTPRRPASHWSPANLSLAAELTVAGLMEPAGAAAYARALADEHAAVVRAQVASGLLPEPYETRLAEDPGAWRFFHERAPASYREMCIHWVGSAKRAATRDRRAAEVIAACAEGRVIAPLASGPVPGWVRRAAGPDQPARRPTR